MYLYADREFQTNFEMFRLIDVQQHFITFMQDLQLLASSTIFMLFFTCQVIIVTIVVVIDKIFIIVV